MRNHEMHEQVGLARRLLTIAVVVLQLAIPLGQVVSPRIADAESTAIETARALYERADYDNAIQTLDAPLGKQELRGSDFKEAHALLARCYVKKGMPEVGRAHFETILKEDRKWTMDQSLIPADEYAVFIEARNLVYPPGPPGGGHKKAWIIGGGALLLGGVIAALVGGDGGGGGGKPPTTLGSYPAHP